MSYTSNSEFDLETRVQITNEIPSLRTYEQMHHSLRNDTWKWLIGTEDVTYDLPIGGKYIVDDNGNTNELMAPPVKIVNGKQASIYGPKVYEKWNPEENKYDTITPTYHRMDINGTYAVEQDLFLHEIYRYLSCIYPDHPDWLNLLTRNEILDAFNNAAAMVDYKPNNEFFKLVADSIESDEPDVEEFKLNLRNLTSNSARRKFYGSSLGFRMFGHDAYEDIMIFPIGKNLTLNAQDKEERRRLKEDGTLDVKNYIIDTFDERYQTLFRRIDWLGENRDTSFVSLNGYNFSSFIMPGYEYLSFEFASAIDGEYSVDKYNLYNDSSYSFYSVNNGESKDIIGSVSSVVQKNILEPKFTETKEGEILNYTSSDDKLLGIECSSINIPLYFKLYKFKTIEHYENFIRENKIDNSLIYFENVFDENDKVTNTSSSYFNKFLEPLFIVCNNTPSLNDYASMYDKIDYLYNPFIKNTILLPTEQMINLYDTFTSFEGTDVVPKGTLSLDNSPLKEGDLISFEDFAKTTNGIAYSIVGASYGSINMSFEGALDVNEYNNILNHKPWDVKDDSIVSKEYISVIIKNKSGKYIELQGSLQCFWTIKRNYSITAYYLSSAKFNIRAIPEKKNEKLYKILYGTEAYDLIDEINESINSKTKELEKNKKLINESLPEDIYGKPLDIYEEYSSKANITVDELAQLNNAIDILKNKTGYFFEEYCKLKSAIEEDNKDLSDVYAKIDEDSLNRDLLLNEDGSLSIGYGSTVENIFIFGYDNTYAPLVFFLEKGTVTDFSLGNISVLPVEPTGDFTIPDWHSYDYVDSFGEQHTRKYSLAKIDLNKVPRDSIYGQLYSEIKSSDISLVFKPTVTTRIYNEKTFSISAQVFIDKTAGVSTNEMQFLSDDSKTKFDSISVGSKVSGPGISSDTYVTSLSNYSLTVNNALSAGGYFVYKFECPVTTSPEDISDDPFNYKRVMNELGIYKKVSFFDHGVYGTKEWPKVSSAIFNGDLKDKQILNTSTFKDVVKYLYEDKLNYNEDGQSSNVLIPSISKYTRDIFVDIKADKIIPLKNYFGTTNNLMNVEWLDYIQNNLELALAKENINVGVNLILNADTSGYASLIKDSSYTDPNLQVLFQTLNWDNNTIPAYVQIGTGGKNMKDFFKLVSNIYYPNVYGATFYDKTVEPQKGAGVEEDNIEDWRNVEGTVIQKRGTYAKVGEINDNLNKYSTYENIDNPIFEIPLNEYNINLRTLQNGKTFTTVDALFYEQEFKNLTKKNDLMIAKNSDLFASFINGYQTVDSLDSSISDNVKYFYLAHEDTSGSERGDFWFTPNDKPDEITNSRWVKYSLVCGGVVGAYVYYFNTEFYTVTGASLFSDVTYSSMIENPDLNSEFMQNPENVLLEMLKILTFYNYNTDNVSEGTTLKNNFLKGEYSNIDDNECFKNKLILFTYIKGNWDLPDTKEDFFGLKDFDLVGILWNGKEPELVNINKNYTICTTDKIEPLSLLRQNEINLFYGYSIYNMISIYGKEEIEKRENEGNGWTAISSDLSQYYMDTSNSIIGYSKIVINTINLPRKYLADGSYNINLYIDPKFIGTGYLYDDYIKGVTSKEVQFNISQSAIKYDEDNDLFYTIAATYNSESKQWEDNKKIVIKFEEHKYFKDLKYLFGAYKTELIQNEGSTTAIKEAYIRSITGEPFNISDLSTSDKFVYAEEVNLRSLYTESYNSRIFQGTKLLRAEIYGMKEDGSLYLSGKRTKEMNRLYDSDLLSTLDSIIPASISGSTVSKIEKYENGLNFNNEDILSPELVNIEIKRAIDSRYIPEETTSFKYFKNLLVFEGLINLKKPDVIESPVDDSSTFNSVLSVLNKGDSIKGIVALSGGGYNTHTITTNIQEKASYFSANDTEAVVITTSGKIYKANNINYESVNYVNFSEQENTVEGSILNMIWSDEYNCFVATIGLERELDEDFGYDYWNSTIVKTIDDNPKEVFNTKFTKNGEELIQFKERDDGIFIPEGLTFNLDDTLVGDKVIEQARINPNDIAIKSYYEEKVENEDEDVVKDDEYYEDLYGPSYENGIHRKITEGPYLVKDLSDTEKSVFRFFSDNDVDIALSQDYMFIKTYNYTVDENGNYTSNKTKNKHWKAIKIPVILDFTLLHLKTMAVQGSNSAYNYVKQAYDNFSEWAFDESMILPTEDGLSVTFKGQALGDSYTKAELENYKKCVKSIKLLTYEEFLKTITYYDGNGNKISSYMSTNGSSVTVNTSTYSEIPVALAKVKADTKLPLRLSPNSKDDYQIKENGNFVIEGTINDYIIQSVPSKNYVNFDEMYYQYLYLALAKIIGGVTSQNFGTKAIIDISSNGNKVYFKTITNDIISISKDKLYKYSDMNETTNWDVSIMPAASYIKGSYDKKIGDFNIVKLWFNNKETQIPVSSRDFNVYLYRLTTDMYISPDGNHIFYGGYTIPYSQIEAAIRSQGQDPNDYVKEEWFVNNLDSWMNGTDKKGKAPFILYSDDAGLSFKILPIKQYVDSSLFSDDDYKVSSFSTYNDNIIAYVKNIKTDVNEAKQIIIGFDSYSGDIDPTLTEYNQVSIPQDGKIYTQEISDGTITWSDGLLGYGVDIDHSEMFGTNTFNFDFTGSNVITIQPNISIKRIDSTYITLNKGISSGGMTSGKLRVLLSVATTNDIPNPREYLTKDLTKIYEYEKANGDFRVATAIEVNNSSTANRIYSPRYINQETDDNGNIIGYPTVEEDVNCVMYEYTENSDGTIGNVIPLTNSFGNEIKLCTEDGKYILLDNSDFKSIEDFVRNEIDVTLAKSAGKNKVSISEASSNVACMTTLTEKSHDYSYLEGPEGAEQKDLISLTEFNTNSFYALIKNSKTLESPTFKEDIFWNIGSFSSDLEIEDIIEEVENTLLSEDGNLNQFIIAKEGYWGYIDNQYSSARDRFEIVIDDSCKEDNNYVYAKVLDKKYNCYIFNKRLFISGTLVMPYTFYNGGMGINVVPNPNIEYSNNKTLIGDGYMSSGIYYHPMGYGGLRNNTSIIDNTPWDRDPEAFDDFLLKNSLGNYVYLTDEFGNKIKVYNSIKISEENEYLKYEDFLNNGYNKLTVKNNDGGHYKIFEYFKLYKNSTIYQKHSIDKVAEGSSVILRAYNNTQLASKIKFTENKEGLYDESGNLAFNATIDDNRVLHIEDHINENNASKVYAYLNAEFDYDGNKQTISFVSEFIVDINMSAFNIRPYDNDGVDIVDNDAILFQKKSDGSYISITNVNLQGNISKTYEYLITSTEKLDKSHFNCDFSGASLDASLKDTEDGKYNYILKLTIILGISEYTDIVIKYNTNEILYIPILEIIDNIWVHKKNGVNKFYLGDKKLPDDFDIKNKLNIIDYEEINEDYTPLENNFKEIKLDIPSGKILTGLFGYSISKAPRYKNFSELIYNLGVMVRSYSTETVDGLTRISSLSETNNKHYFNESDLSNLTISQIAEDNSELKLKEASLTDFNDNKEHYFMFKILTIAHQNVAVENMNNEEYYREVSINEMSTFPPDRVWYNPKGSPKPPIKVGEVIFNEENNYAYYSNDYVNANKYKIRLCDEHGHYINYDSLGNEYRLDRNGDGNCSDYIYAGQDGRYISPEPVNTTCQEWYKDNMWAKNKDVNPLWQVISITPKIENKKWKQNTILGRFIKSGNNQIISSDIDYPYVTIENLINISTNDGVISYDETSDSLNLEEGVIRLLLSEGSTYYRDNKELTMYGLHFLTSEMSEIYTENSFDICATLQASYTVNTARDFTTKIQENRSIVNITELGIFDREHKLIAYANFPAIEYRSDTQHAAFTCIIYHGNMVET